MGTRPPDQPSNVASPLEQAIRASADEGRFADAVTVAIEGYGQDLLMYLHALVRDEDEARELFAEASMRIWLNLPKFRWHSSFRTWAHAIARNLACDAHRKRQRERARHVGLSDAPEVAAIAAAVRSTTLLHLRGESERQLDALRASLDYDERTLLILSLDQRMSWREIAEVMSDGETDERELHRLSARLRKRFERLKDRLREHLRESMTRD
jgi:RNA polymerase sigma-70 factor, ECF subfamily